MYLCTCILDMHPGHAWLASTGLHIDLGVESRLCCCVNKRDFLRIFLLLIIVIIVIFFVAIPAYMCSSRNIASLSVAIASSHSRYVVAPGSHTRYARSRTGSSSSHRRSSDLL